MSEPRAAVLAVLRSATAPLTAADVAAQLAVHVTTARFHLNNLVDDGRAVSMTLRADTVGRPRVGYAAVAELEVDDLLSILLEQLAGSAPARERAAAAAGRAWAARHTSAAPPPPTPIELPDPVVVTTDALRQLGFKVSDVMSAFGTHEIRLCSCPLRQVGAAHPEIARGITRGAIEQVLESTSTTLADNYDIHVEPAPAGDCEITLRLSRATAASRSSRR